MSTRKPPVKEMMVILATEGNGSCVERPKNLFKSKSFPNDSIFVWHSMRNEHIPLDLRTGFKVFYLSLRFAFKRPHTHTNISTLTRIFFYHKAIFRFVNERWHTMAHRSKLRMTTLATIGCLSIAWRTVGAFGDGFVQG